MPLAKIIHSFDQDAMALWNANFEEGLKIAKATDAKEVWPGRGNMPTIHLMGLPVTRCGGRGMPDDGEIGSKCEQAVALLVGSPRVGGLARGARVLSWHLRVRANSRPTRVQGRGRPTVEPQQLFDPVVSFLTRSLCRRKSAESSLLNAHMSRDFHSIVAACWGCFPDQINTREVGRYARVTTKLNHQPMIPSPDQMPLGRRSRRANPIPRRA
jgi:hypothetical protein